MQRHHKMLIAVALVITLFPVYWIAINSFKFDIDIFAVPPLWVPSNPTLKHYIAAFIERPFLLYALNSFLIAVLGSAPIRASSRSSALSSGNGSMRSCR